MICVGRFDAVVAWYVVVPDDAAELVEFKKQTSRMNKKMLQVRLHIMTPDATAMLMTTCRHPISLVCAGGMQCLALSVGLTEYMTKRQLIARLKDIVNAR